MAENEIKFSAVPVNKCEDLELPLKRERQDEKQAQCPLCDRTLLKKCLPQHMKSHSGVKPYSCEICKKSFTRMSTFRIHSDSHGHSGEKNFACEVCNKRFSHKRYLRQHFRIHVRQRSFECEFCKKRFFDASVKKAHLRIHTNEKPYVCEICNRRFTQCNNLTVHRRIHDTNGHTCKICQKVFVNGNQLKVHKRTYHSLKPQQPGQGRLADPPPLIPISHDGSPSVDSLKVQVLNIVRVYRFWSLKLM